PEIHLRTDQMSIEEAVERIVELLTQRGLLKDISGEANGHLNGKSAVADSEGDSKKRRL
ncbi:hypothetical protein HK101_002913, partial [Irineochytrium annulatum]